MTSCYATYPDGRIKIIANGLYPNANGEMTITYMQDPEELADGINAAFARQRALEVRDQYRTFYRQCRVSKTTNLLYSTIERSVMSRCNLDYVRANACTSYSNRRDTPREQGLHTRLIMSKVLGKVSAFGSLKTYRQNHYPQGK